MDVGSGPLTGTAASPRHLAPRFAGFYCVYFATLGALLPYWSLYLESLGMGAVQIGLLVGAIQLTKVVGPNLWGPLADRTGRRMAVARGTAFLAFLAFLPLYAFQGFWAMLPVVALFALFHAGPLPLVEGAVWDLVRRLRAHYGRIRLWGSIGFIATAVGLGPLLDRHGLGLILHCLAALFLGIFLLTWLVPEPVGGGETRQAGSPFRRLRQPHVWGFFATTFLMQASHGVYYGFFSIHLQDHGFSRLVIGLLWGLGVLAEVVAFLGTDQLVRRLGVRSLLIGSLALAGFRWALIGATLQPVWLLVAQTLHAATFAVFHAAAARHTHDLFPEWERSSGFALYSSLAFGLGGGLGTLLAGSLWGLLGGSGAFVVAAGLALAGLAVMLQRESPRGPGLPPGKGQGAVGRSGRVGDGILVG